jgi:hypothetical protein
MHQKNQFSGIKNPKTGAGGKRYSLKLPLALSLKEALSLNVSSITSWLPAMVLVKKRARAKPRLPALKGGAPVMKSVKAIINHGVSRRKHGGTRRIADVRRL